MNFEEAMEKLEHIVNDLENGKKSLDESMDLFQQGIALTRLCNQQLGEYEKKLSFLVEKEDGSFEEKEIMEEAGI